jgi:NitT/TauT family transport system permease protein
MSKYIFLGPILIICVWVLVSVFKLASPLFLPSFFETINTLLILLRQGNVFLDIWATVYRTLTGFFVAGVLGVPLGLLVGNYLKLYKTFEVVIDFFRSLPGTALFPLFLLIFGIGDGSKIATAVFVSLWIILVNSAYGVLYSSKLRQKVGFTLGANRFQIFRDIVLMDALPQVFVGLRTALSISLVVVVVSEMFIGSKFGLGQKIFDAYLTYETTKLYAILLITGLLGYTLNKIFVAFEKKMVHWAGK